MKSIFHHTIYYGVLLAVLVFGAVVILLLNNMNTLQLYVAFSLYLFYLVWGVLHHAFHHKLTVKLVMEYALIGLIGLALLTFILIGGLVK